MPIPGTSRIIAWAVHALTASGVVISLLSLVAILKGNAQEALLWLGLGLLFAQALPGFAVLARTSRLRG